VRRDSNRRFFDNGKARAAQAWSQNAFAMSAESPPGF
jgi:hypothetical protein